MWSFQRQKTEHPEGVVCVEAYFVFLFINRIKQYSDSTILGLLNLITLKNKFFIKIICVIENKYIVMI